MQLHVQLNDFLHMSILKANHLMAHGSWNPFDIYYLN
jgi:predicted nuclease of predicted toxin-antitoxin system